MVSVINRETFFECDSWEHAQKNSCGYDNSELLAFYENINSNSQRPSSSHLLEPRLIELFCAIQRAAKNLGTVSIADVGGANGYLGVHALNFFDLNLKWTVFEQEVFVDLYKKIPNSKIEFANINKFKTNLTFSISLFSCSLQYIFNCYELLTTAFQNSSFVILSRIPILDHKNDKVTIQKVKLDGKEFTWPAYFFGQCFMDFISKRAEVIYRWQTPSEQVLFQGKIISFQGMLLKPK